VIACSLFFERARRGQAMIAAADNQLGNGETDRARLPA
jgi:hypothetical protein